MASLYHSGSSVKRTPSLPARVALALSALLFGLLRLRRTLLFAGMSMSCLSCADTPYSVGMPVRIEAQRLTPAVPVETPLLQQIFDLQMAIVGQAKIFQRQVDFAMLRLERIEIDRHQHHVVAETLGAGGVGRRPATSRFNEVQDVVVAHRQEAHAQMTLQGWIFGTQTIQARNVVDDVAGTLPVPGADFVFLGVQVFFLARHRPRFA